MVRGTQIAYVPNHANGKLDHPDVEFGFVMSRGDDVHFCRYWVRGAPGMLRTLANSEATPDWNLVEHQSVLQSVVVMAIAGIESQTVKP